MLLTLDRLPEDVGSVLQFLETEGVPLSYWWDVARAYLAQGRPQHFVQLLHSSLDEELLQAVQDFFKARPTFDIVQMNCGLAAYHIESARAAEPAERDRHRAAAAERVAAAKKEGPDEQLPHLAAGLLALQRVRPPGRGSAAVRALRRVVVACSMSS